MSLAFLILLIVAVAGSVGMTAVVAWLIHRTARVQGGDPFDGERLVAVADDLREQLLALEDEMARLRERVDFTEKLLERPRDRPEAHPPGPGSDDSSTG